MFEYIIMLSDESVYVKTYNTLRSAKAAMTRMKIKSLHPDAYIKERKDSIINVESVGE